MPATGQHRTARSDTLWRIYSITRNHLPGGRDLAALSVGGFAESILDGVGFGLGGSASSSTRR